MQVCYRRLVKPVIIVGGGLAGLTAALSLAESGRDVTVYESSAVLGGKAASWRDGDGDLVEAGLHVCFPYYERFLALLDRVGASGCIGWRDTEFAYLGPAGRVDTLRFRPLPPPLHGVAAILGFGAVPLRHRLTTALGAAEATLLPPSWLARYDDRTFAHWAAQRGLSRAVVAGVFEPMVRGLTFLGADEVSARAMLGYIHRIGASSDVCRVGLFRAGMSEAIMSPLRDRIVALGGRVLLESPVRELVVEAGRVKGVLAASGVPHFADDVVLAVPSHTLAHLWPAGTPLPSAVSHAGQLRPAPVASVLLTFDRKIAGPRGVRFSAGTCFNTWADMTELLTELRDAPGSVLQLVVAPMTPLRGLDDAALVARIRRELGGLDPAYTRATLLKSVVTRLPESVFSSVPGAEAFRPPPGPVAPGLHLCGDYTATGEAPNMESAVRSGEAVGRTLARHS